jgi:hypothetical protein
MMFVTLVAILCHVSPGPSGVCVEEIVTDSSKSDISFQSCMIQGQIGVAKWMSEHPIYRADWTLQRYKCAPGHYSPHIKAWPMLEQASWRSVLRGTGLSLLGWNSVRTPPPLKCTSRWFGARLPLVRAVTQMFNSDS